MATPYSGIYSIFMSKITDYDYLTLTDAQIDSTLIDYLHSATIDFKGCRNSLSFDDVNNQFTADLTYEEQDILACFMILRWLSPKINNTLSLKQVMTDKDFIVSSQANHLKEMQKLRKDLYAEAKALVRQYTWDNPSQIGKLVTTDSYPMLTDYGIGGNDLWGGAVDEDDV